MKDGLLALLVGSRSLPRLSPSSCRLLGVFFSQIPIVSEAKDPNHGSSLQVHHYISVSKGQEEMKHYVLFAALSRRPVVTGNGVVSSHIAVLHLYTPPTPTHPMSFFLASTLSSSVPPRVVILCLTPHLCVSSGRLLPPLPCAVTHEIPDGGVNRVVGRIFTQFFRDAVNRMISRWRDIA